MKKILIIITLFLLNPCGFAYSQGFDPYHTDAVIYNGYSYPVFPGTDEWTEMNHTQRLEVLQIPSDTLTNISTSRLLETCLYYPFNIDIVINENHFIGFEKVCDDFNGYTELFQRDNFIKELIDLYSSRDVYYIEQIDDAYDRGQYSFDFFIMELMIYKGIDDATEDQLIQIIELVVEKQSQKESLDEYYSDFGIAEEIIGKIETLGISDYVLEFNIEISPNPVTDNITVNYSLPFKGNFANFSICDIYGKKVMTIRLDNKKESMTLNVENLSPGMYIYSLEYGKSVKSGKLIKK